jgi:tetratricopeptide (TPR) repeat protein
MKRVGQSLVVAAMLAIGAGVAMAQVDLELVPHPDVDQLKPEVRDNLRPAIEYFRTQRATLEGRKLGLAYGRIGINYLAYEQQAAAGACLRNAMALDPANPRWPYLLAVHYQETGFLDKSVESYRDALLADRTYLPGYVRLGRVLLEIGKLDEADSAFQVVLNANPAEAAALAGTGQVAFQRQEYEKAADFYQRALEIQPEASSLHYHLGMTYRALGRTDEARAQMDKAGERIPTVDDPMLAFVQAHTRGAAHYLEAAVKADESGHTAVAARFYEIATSIQPTNVPALVRLGELQGAAGNSDAALNAFARVLSIDPGNARANYFAGTLLEQRGDDEEARKLYEKALESQPQLVEPRMLLANAQMRVGEFAAAGDNYAQIAHQLPESKEVRYLLGLAWLAAGQCEWALQVLSQAVAMMPGDPQALIALARAYSTCPEATDEQRQQALGAARSMYEKAPGLDTAETLAMASAANGEFQDAVDFQSQAMFEALKLDQKTRLAWMQENLQRYRDSQVAASPWNADADVFKPRRLQPPAALANSE